MVVLHHLNRSRSQRVLWLMEELGLSYEIRNYQRDPLTMFAPAELRQIHPLGKSPVITDGDVTMAESGAIIEYLIAQYGDGQLIPEKGSQEYNQYLYWMHFAEGSLMPPLLVKLILDKIATAPMPFFIKPIARKLTGKAISAFVVPNTSRLLDFIEQHLSNRTWFAGKEITGADIQMSFPLEAARSRGAIGEQYPNILAWIERIRARPAYQKALSVGGEYF